MSHLFEQFGWWAAVDVLIIATVIYQVLLLIKGTRAFQMLIGILIVSVTYWLSNMVPLTTINWILNKFYASFVLVLIILFQDDIRLVLRRMGKQSFLGHHEEPGAAAQLLEELSRAAFGLAARRTGALLVLERNIVLNRYIDIGIPLDGKVSKEVILAIFHTSSLVHDGAIIIQKGRIAAVGCFLPLTKEENLDLQMGTRHRAALGMSQETDAIVVLVSEERGTVTLAVEGEFIFVDSPIALRKALNRHFIENPSLLGFTHSENASWVVRVKELKKTFFSWWG